MSMRGAAIWALGQLDEAKFFAEKPNRLKFESDENALQEWEVSAPSAR